MNMGLDIESWKKNEHGVSIGKIGMGLDMDMGMNIGHTYPISMLIPQLIHA